MKAKLVLLVMVVFLTSCGSIPQHSYYEKGIYVEQNGIDVFYKNGLPVDDKE
jgi:uncharacterized protein YceK